MFNCSKLRCLMSRYNKLASVVLLEQICPKYFFIKHIFPHILLWPWVIPPPMIFTWHPFLTHPNGTSPSPQGTHFFRWFFCRWRDFFERTEKVWVNSAKKWPKTKQCQTLLTYSGQMTEMSQQTNLSVKQNRKIVWFIANSPIYKLGSSSIKAQLAEESKWFFSTSCFMTVRTVILSSIIIVFALSSLLKTFTISC